MGKQIITVHYKNQDLDVSILVARRTDQWVVCLHGLQANAELFSDLFNQSFLDNYSLLAISFIGFGDSTKPDDFSYDVADQAEVTKLVLNELGIKQLHLIGHSLGGMVGTLLLEPLRANIMSFANLEGNLVLADCGDSKNVAQYSEADFKKYGYDNLKESIRQSGQKSASYRYKRLEIIPAKVFYKTSTSIVDWSKSEKLLDLFVGSQVKRMFMYGSRNAVKADTLVESISKVVIDEAGHFMLLDNPQACYAALNDFIEDKKL